MYERTEKFVPEITSALRNNLVKVPDVIKNCSGIRIFGKRIKSILFSTDVAVIENSNADAVIAVYPFTPNPSITQAILTVADVPVFMGVGGGLTGGLRSVNVALDAEFQGGIGVVFNAPTSVETILKTRQTVDIPIILTIITDNVDLNERIAAGVEIFNVSGGARTPELVSHIRKQLPEFPIIATGGPTEESIMATIEAGANAITYTPPTTTELMKEKMDVYRHKVRK